jgi:hypothetical protein
MGAAHRRAWMLRNVGIRVFKEVEEHDISAVTISNVEGSLANVSDESS